MHVGAEFLSPYEAVLLWVKVQDSALLWLPEAGSSFSAVKDEMFTFAVNFPPMECLLNISVQQDFPYCNLIVR